MRSTLVWLGVLVGSVGLGVGMYTFVVAPGTQGMTVSGTTAAPEPRPTVMKYKTKVVKDPPKTKIVDVPVQAASGGGQAAGTGSSGGSTGSQRVYSTGSGGENEGVEYENDDSEDISYGGGGNNNNGGDDDGNYEDSQADDAAQEAAENQREAAQESAENQREAAQESAENQREAAQESDEDGDSDEKDD